MSYGSTKNFNACELTTVRSTETPANEGEGGVAVTHTKHCTRPFCISTLQASTKLGGDLKTSFKAAHVSVVRSHWVAFSWVCVSVWSTKILGVFPVLTRAAKNTKGPRDTYRINDIR